MNIKNTFTILLVSCFFSISGNAQDLIVTTQNDSLEVEITKTDKDYVYYLARNINGTYSNSMILTSTVAEIIRNYYGESTETYYKPAETIVTREEFNWQSKRISLRGFGGWSYRLSPVVDNEFADYTRELKSGYHIGGELTVFFNEMFGVSFAVNSHRASTDPIRVMLELDNGQSIETSMSDEVTINTFAPNFVVRFQMNNPSERIYLRAGLGYVDWKQKTDFTIDYLKMKGYTVGLNVGARYEFDLATNVGFNVGLDFYTATISSVEASDAFGNKGQLDLDVENAEGLLRLNLHAGLAINL